MRFSTRARVRSPISMPPRNTFDTVTVDTPRSAAMSFNLTAISLPRSSEARLPPQRPSGAHERGEQCQRQHRDPTQVHRQGRHDRVQTKPQKEAGRRYHDGYLPPASLLGTAAEFVSALRQQHLAILEAVTIAFACQRLIARHIFTRRSDRGGD